MNAWLKYLRSCNLILMLLLLSSEVCSMILLIDDNKDKSASKYSFLSLSLLSILVILYGIHWVYSRNLHKLLWYCWSSALVIILIWMIYVLAKIFNNDSDWPQYILFFNIGKCILYLLTILISSLERKIYKAATNVVSEKEIILDEEVLNIIQHYKNPGEMHLLQDSQMIERNSQLQNSISKDSKVKDDYYVHSSHKKFKDSVNAQYNNPASKSPLLKVEKSSSDY